MEYDLLTLGETMLALAPQAGGAIRDAPALLVDHAGAESNTGVGLARLGHRVAWVSRLGAAAAGVRYYRRDSAASVMGPELLDSVPVGVARAVLVTGVTALIGPRPQAA